MMEFFYERFRFVENDVNSLPSRETSLHKFFRTSVANAGECGTTLGT